jgi:histidinol-phosphate aminotransferase
LGSRALIAALNTVKNSFNSYTLDRLAQVGSMAAMADEAYFQETRNKIMATRIRVTDRLTNMGFQVIPSAANFIFASHGQKAAEDLFEGLRSRGILVRYFKKPLIANYVRITIGTDEEMEAFLKAIGELTN